nr:reverse transcriptase domain-containing protein [Tanacetum cinerariifolium]
MRTRNSYFPNNSSSTIPRRRNKRRTPIIVEPELRTIVEMADNRTMEELLQAPTEGYREAIFILEINADHFEIKTNLLQLVQANPYHGFERENPHTHINNFKMITSTLKFRDVPNDVIKLMMFSYSLEGNARVCFADALILMPKFATTIKSLLTNKDKLFELAKIPLNENCSAMLLKKLLEKLGDPGKFLIPCDFSGMDIYHALVDLGASINLMPLSIWKKLSLPELTPTRMTLELEDRSITRPKGVTKDVFVKVGKFHFPTDFVVVDFEADPRVPLTLGRSFLRTGHSLIDVYGEEITLRVNDEAITFNLNQTTRYSSTYDDLSVNRIDIIDVAREDIRAKSPYDNKWAKKAQGKAVQADCDIKATNIILQGLPPEVYALVSTEAVTFNLNQTTRYSSTYDDLSVNRIDITDDAREEYAQEFLGFSSNSSGGNPTLTFKPILSDSSLSLTLFEGSDFILEEIDAYLKDELVSLKIDHADCDPEGDICLIENLLNNDPFQLPPMDLKQVEVVKANSSIEEPSELELNELPSHLEYSYLEGVDKLPVVISKDLKVDEKEALLKVLKSHKRVIAWKITDIKGIDPRFCTHKILMEEDYKPAVQSQRRVNLKIHEETPFGFSKDCIKAFDTLKKKLTEAPILVVPDWNLPFELMCDASDFAIGACSELARNASRFSALGHHQRRNCWHRTLARMADPSLEL